jgi:hypothetical protein
MATSQHGCVTRALQTVLYPEQPADIDCAADKRDKKRNHHGYNGRCHRLAITRDQSDKAAERIPQIQHSVLHCLSHLF